MILSVIARLFLQDDPLIAEFSRHLQAAQAARDDGNEAAAAESYGKASLIYQRVGEAYLKAHQEGNAVEKELAEIRREKLHEVMGRHLGVGAGRKETRQFLVRRLLELGAAGREESVKALKQAHEVIKQKLQAIGVTDDFQALVPKLAPEENAAELYMRIFPECHKLWEAARKDKNSFCSGASDLASARRVKDQARAFLEASLPIVKATRQALDRKGCNFSFDPLSEVFDGPPFLGLGVLGEILKRCALAHSVLEEHREARKLAFMTLRLSMESHTEPLMDCVSMRCNMLIRARETVQQVFAADLPTEEELNEFDQALERWNPRKAVDRALQGEAGRWVPLLEKICLRRVEKVVPRLPVELEVAFYEDVGNGLDCILRLLKLTDRDHHAVEKEFQAIFESVEDLPLTSRVPLPQILVGILMNGRAEAEIRVLRSAIGALRYQRTHGRLPESLQTKYVDPFSGQALIYRNRVIYSVGRNKTDDGGSLESDDISFTLR